MTNPIQVGDRVQWRSRRRNKQGLYRRVGTVLKFSATGYYAYVQPDKGHGHRQSLATARLTKVEVQPCPTNS